MSYNSKTYAIDNKFNLPSFITTIPTRTYVIVSYDWDIVTLYIVKQEEYPNHESIDEIEGIGTSRRVILRDGVMFIETENGRYTLEGKEVF